VPAVTRWCKILRFACSDCRLDSFEGGKALEDQTDGWATVAGLFDKLINRQAGWMTHLEHDERHVESDAAISDPTLLVDTTKQLQHLYGSIDVVIIVWAFHNSIVVVRYVNEQIPSRAALQRNTQIGDGSKRLHAFAAC
jgi:hypothetical protein